MESPNTARELMVRSSEIGIHWGPLRQWVRITISGSRPVLKIANRARIQDPYPSHILRLFHIHVMRAFEVNTFCGLGLPL